MDITSFLYILAALTVILSIALALCYKSYLNLKSSVTDDCSAHEELLVSLKNIQSKNFIQSIGDYQNTIAQSHYVNTKVSKLGHDINGALQVLMFTLSRIKKKNSNIEIEPLVIKADDSIKKIADLISSHKSSSKEESASGQKINLAELANSLIELYKGASKSKNLSYTVICEASSTDVVINKNEKELLERILKEIFEDYILCAVPNLTLPFSIIKSPRRTLIETTFNSRINHVSFIQKYTSLKEEIAPSSISLKISKLNNNYHKIVVTIPD